MRRKLAGAAAAALLLSAPRVRAASADPELAPLPPRRSVQPRLAPPPRRPRPAPPAPPERDEVRERLRHGPPPRAFLTLRSRLWLASSSVNTRYSIQIPREQISPPGEVFVGETEERTASGAMAIYGVELAPLSWLSAEFEYGRDRQAGRYTDRYWLHSPHSETLTKLSNGAVWNRPDHEDDTVLTADHDARREWLSFSAYFRLAEGRVTGSDELEVRHAFDVAAGGHRFLQKSRFTNLAVALSAGKLYPQSPLGPIPGFDSSYTAQWRGPHLGFREEITVPAGFSFNALVLWSPLIQYRGEGFANLDPDLRASSPNYTDTAKGSAVHFRLGAAWSWSVARIEAGYMRLAFTSNHGNRRYHLADGSDFDRAVETTRTESSGLYAGASLRF